MSESEKKKELRRGNVKLDPSLHRELLHYCVDRNLTLGQVIESAWRQFIESAAAIRVATGKKILEVPPDVMELIEEFIELRNSEDAEDREYYRSLRMSVSYIRKKRMEYMQTESEISKRPVKS